MPISRCVTRSAGSLSPGFTHGPCWVVAPAVRAKSGQVAKLHEAEGSQDRMAYDLCRSGLAERERA